MNDRIKAVIEHPLHKYLGISEIASTDGCGSLTFTAGEKLINPAGILHGGTIYLLCDVCAYIGILSILPAGKEAFTHDIHISMIRSAKLGDVVKINSRVTKLGRNLCFAEATATVAGDIIATARITKSVMAVKSKQSAV